MSYVLQVDSSNQVSFEPEYDYSREDRKIQDEHRSRNGTRYVYKWGEYRKFSFSVVYVNSRDASIVNSWWSSNTKLQFYSTSDSQVSSVQLVGERPPLGKFVKPHTDLYLGTIELEGF